MKYGDESFVRRKLWTSSKVYLTLLLFGVYGSLSVLLDVDHVIVLVQKSIPITLTNLDTLAGRPLHIPVIVLCWACVGYHYTRYYRHIKEIKKDD